MNHQQEHRNSLLSTQWAVSLLQCLSRSCWDPALAALANSAWFSLSFLWLISRSWGRASQYFLESCPAWLGSSRVFYWSSGSRQAGAVRRSTCCIGHLGFLSGTVHAGEALVGTSTGDIWWTWHTLVSSSTSNTWGSWGRSGSWSSHAGLESWGSSDWLGIVRILARSGSAFVPHPLMKAPRGMCWLLSDRIRHQVLYYLVRNKRVNLKKLNKKNF